jgi:hypothetical protein
MTPIEVSLMHKVANKTLVPSPGTSIALLNRLINAPDLVRSIRSLPPQTFAKLIRQIGIEDAGEIIALATTAQLVTAFDENLFVNSRPGERETFDGTRFIGWLEVLLEAGDEVAADRVAELSEDFVTLALSSTILVINHDTLLVRMREWGDDAIYAEKVIEGSHFEELDGFLLISRIHDGWDAVFSLILALDRHHRALLVRVLDRCADIADEYTHDLDELLTVLSSEDSLREDVEAERENRRSKQGYVEPRAARSFLTFAREPLTTDVESGERDPVTRAYFRDIDQSSGDTNTAFKSQQNLVALLNDIDTNTHAQSDGVESLNSDAPIRIVEAMSLLNNLEPRSFSERVEEMHYLANVLIAGATTAGNRFRPADAAEAVLATVGLGAELMAQKLASADHHAGLRSTPEKLCNVLRSCKADLLFRMASSTLVAQKTRTASAGFLISYGELERILTQF